MTLEGLEATVMELYSVLGHEIVRVMRRSDHTFELIIKAANGEKWIARCETSAEVSISVVQDLQQFYNQSRLSKLQYSLVVLSHSK